MGRKSSFAGVYMLVEMGTGKFYIGESANVLRRITEHTTSKNSPMYHKKVIPIILESSLVDENLFDQDYRSDREEYYIQKFNATSSGIGYNKLAKQWHTKRSNLTSAQKRFNQLCENIKKGSPIIVYDSDNGDSFIYISRKSFANDLGLDRSIVARAVKTGKRVRQFHVYDLDANERLKHATDVVKHKLTSNDTNGFSKRSLVTYRDGLIAANAICEYWKLPTIELKSLL